MKSKKKKLNFIECLEAHNGLIASACKQANICRKTYYNWIDSDPGFKEMAMEVIERCNDFAEDVLIRCMSQDNMVAVAAADKFLSAHARHRGYGKQDHEHSGELIININRKILSDES